MARINQFGGVPGTAPGGGRDCLPFEAMLADVIDGTLSTGDRARFDEHLASCEQCPGMLADARRGRSLLEMLRPEVPEPSPALLGRIFAQTSVQRAKDEEAARAERRAAQEAASLLGPRQLATMPAAAVAVPEAGVTGVAGFATTGPGMGKVLPFRDRLQSRLRSARHTVFQPRFAMTAAMAFFSIALTLNLSGVRVSQFRLSDLRPSNVKRGVYEARARVVRYYANLRVVYELESRVHDLQRSDDDAGRPDRSATPTPKNPQTPDGQEQPAPGAKGAPDGKGKGDAAPASARPSGPGKTENPGPEGARPGAAGQGNGQPSSARNRSNSPSSRCAWPLPGLQEVRFASSPRDTSVRSGFVVPYSALYEPQEKRGLA